MAADPETLLFARFRDEGDVGALGQLYDLTAAELLRVAFHLVRDPARAEDLVQQTFVAAIEGAGRFDAQRSVRSWLLGILANQARKLQRAEARVPPPGVDATVDPLAVVQTQEFTAAVDAAISTLPEVYQPVLVLHLKHGMIAAEIAHALRRPPGTVRTQLMRALDLLKKALPPSIAVGACVLSTPLRGLAAVKQAVLADAATHVAAAGAAGGAAGAVATASLVGGTVLMKKVIAAIACAAVLCLGAFVWLENNRAAANAAHTRDPAALVQASLASRAEPPVSQQPSADAQRELQVAPTHGSLRYRFLWEEDRTPAVGVFVDFAVWGRPNPHFATIDAQTDDSGEIALTGLEPGNVGIYVDRAEGASPSVVAGEEATGTVLIPRGVTVDVVVQDDQQRPVRGARVWLSHYGNGTEGHEVGLTDAAGRTTIRDVGEAREVGARADGYAPTDLCRVGGKPGDRVGLLLTLGARCASLHGTVRDATARPVAGARVRIEGFARVTDPEPGLVANSPPPPIDVRTDANGRYEVRGLPAEQVVVRARAATSGSIFQLVTLQAGEARQLDVTLPDGASITGFVRDAEGRGIAGAHVGGGSDYGGLSYCSTSSAADGAFVLQGLTPRRSVAVGVSHQGYLAARETFVLGDGEQRAFDFVLAQSRADDQISGVLVDEQNRPLPKWIVNIRPVVEDAQWWAYERTNAEGRFLARGCPDLECVLEVFDPEGPGGPYALVSLGHVRRGMNDLRVRVPASALRFASLCGRIVDADGHPVHGAEVSVHDPGVSTFRSSSTDTGGRFRAERLPPRTYRLEVAASGLPNVALGESALAPDEQHDLGTIVMPRGGRVALRCTFEVNDRRWWASLRTAAGENLAGFEWGPQPHESRLLAPGRYELCVCGDGIAATARDVEVTDGQTTDVEVVLQRGVSHTIGIREPRMGSWQRLDLAVTDAAGRRIWGLDHLSRRGKEEITAATCLGVGIWQVRAETDTGLTGTATIHVADVTIAPAPVVVELR